MNLWQELLKAISRPEILEDGEEVLSLFYNPKEERKERVLGKGNQVRIQILEEDWKNVETLEVLEALVPGSSFTKDGEGHLWMCLRGNGGFWTYRNGESRWFLGTEPYLFYSPTRDDVALIYAEGKNLSGLWLASGKRIFSPLPFSRAFSILSVEEEESYLVIWVLEEGFDLVKVSSPLGSFSFLEEGFFANEEPPTGVKAKNGLAVKEERKVSLRVRARPPKRCGVSDSPIRSASDPGFLIQAEAPKGVWKITSIVRSKEKGGELVVSGSPPRKARMG